MESNESDTGIPQECPKCGNSLKVRYREYGTYLDCTNYPECKYTYDLSGQSIPKTAEIDKSGISIPKNCPRCSKQLALYIGKNRAFFGCNGYPNCRFSLSIVNIDKILCPNCGKLMTERTGTHGLFLGCTGYPDCEFTYDLRISKSIKNEINLDKKIRKKLEINSINNSLSYEQLLNSLLDEWQSTDQIASKLNLIDEHDLFDIRLISMKMNFSTQKG